MNMNPTAAVDVENASSSWWRTGVIDMSPGVIRYRGYAIEDRSGNGGVA